MNTSLRDSVYLQRERLAHTLRYPLEQLALRCGPQWGDREGLNRVLINGIGSIPHCAKLYCVSVAGIQVCDTVGLGGVDPLHFGRDRSQRPYMKEVVPAWGFLLSDAYINLPNHRPSLTALQVVRSEAGIVGFLGADFDLCDLPVTQELYQEPVSWRQIKGDPAIRGLLFQQCRVESPMDRNHEMALSILEELLTLRGVFQCQIHFSSSRVTVWTLDDPYRYRILDHEDLSDPDICLVYPVREYPQAAKIPKSAVAPILNDLRMLRLADEIIYLRTSSINLFNGLVSLTFSCDGSHYMAYDEFLSKKKEFWFGKVA